MRCGNQEAILGGADAKGFLEKNHWIYGASIGYDFIPCEEN